MTGNKRLITKIAVGILGIIILFILIVFINLIISGRYESIVTKGQPVGRYSNPGAALLVIDIQESTTVDLSAVPFYRENSDELIKNINKAAESFIDKNMPVVHIRSEISNPLINLINSSFAIGSRGAQFDKRVKTTSGLEVVKRAKDSFKNTNLDSILISNHISELYIAGLDAAECINATVEASQNRNYKVSIIEEAVLSGTTGMKDSMIKEFKDRGVRVLHIDSLSLMN